MIFDFVEILFTAGFWAATIRIACPLIFATLGELICERAGVLNLGIEGIMSVGAMVGWMAVYQGAGLYSGILIAAFAGGYVWTTPCNFFGAPRCFTARHWDRDNHVGFFTWFLFFQTHLTVFYYPTKNRTLSANRYTLPIRYSLSW